jgi:hypothetical protein
MDYGSLVGFALSTVLSESFRPGWRIPAGSVVLPAEFIVSMAKLTGRRVFALCSRAFYGLPGHCVGAPADFMLFPVIFRGFRQLAKGSREFCAASRQFFLFPAHFWWLRSVNRAFRR